MNNEQLKRSVHRNYTNNKLCKIFLKLAPLQYTEVYSAQSIYIKPFSALLLIMHSGALSNTLVKLFSLELHSTKK